MTTPRSALATALPALLGALGLSACGGGSSGGGGDDPGTASGREARFNWGYEAVGAPAARDAEANGAGVTVAVIDSGVDIYQPQLEGSFVGSVEILDGEVFDEAGNIDDHATWVANIITAADDGEELVGVAPEARILDIDACSDNTDACFETRNLATAFDYATDEGADIINASLGGDFFTADEFDAVRRATDRGVIVVAAAGNEGLGNFSYPARFSSDPAFNGRLLAVGALRRNGTLASYSNTPADLDEAERYLVAPGDEVATLGVDGERAIVSGTSFAAPHVSGALAALRSAAPFLSTDDLVDLILTTAVDLGAPGTDLTYGRGAVDLERALEPVGLASAPLGDAVDGPALALSGEGLSFGTAAAPLDLKGAVGFDGYGRAFDLAALAPIERRRREGLLERRLLPADRVQAPLRTGGLSGTLGLSDGATLGRGDDRASLDAALAEQDVAYAYGGFADAWGGSWRLGFGEAAGTVDPMLASAGGFDPTLGLSEGGLGLAREAALSESARLGLALSAGDGPSGRGAQTLSARTALRFDVGGGALTLGHGVLREDGAALGSGGSGGLSLADAGTTQFLDLGVERAAGLWRLSASGSVGLSDIEGSAGLNTSYSSLWSAGWRLGAERAGVLSAADRFHVALSQPLRVEAGDVSAEVATGRTLDGGVIRERREQSAAPDGRELMLELGYGNSWGATGLQAWTWLREEPNHDAGASDELGLALQLTHRF